MKYMELALEEAKKAYDADEIPVGTVIVKNNEIIAKAHNTSETECDCTCHAEINAIREACKALGTKTLSDCELYVTIEPCAMCAGAIINARIKRLYISSPEPKTGCCGSRTDLTKSALFNHNIEVYWGFNEDESRALMQDFFKEKRN